MCSAAARRARSGFVDRRSEHVHRHVDRRRVPVAAGRAVGEPPLRLLELRVRVEVRHPPVRELSGQADVAGPQRAVVDRDRRALGRERLPERGPRRREELPVVPSGSPRRYRRTSSIYSAIRGRGARTPRRGTLDDARVGDAEPEDRAAARVRSRVATACAIAAGVRENTLTIPVASPIRSVWTAQRSSLPNADFPPPSAAHALSYQAAPRGRRVPARRAARRERRRGRQSPRCSRRSRLDHPRPPRVVVHVQPADRALADLVDVDVPHVLEPLAVVVDAVEGPLTDDAIAVDGPLAERPARALVARFEEREKRRRGVRPLKPRSRDRDDRVVGEQLADGPRSSGSPIRSKNSTVSRGVRAMIPVRTRRDINRTADSRDADRRSQTGRVASGADSGKSVLAHERRRPPPTGRFTRCGFFPVV